MINPTNLSAHLHGKSQHIKRGKAIMPSELKYQVEQAGHDSHFFTRKTMKFFGDTMRNYGVRHCGDMWELYRKKPVNHGLQSSAYFCKFTFKRITIKAGE